MRERLIPQYLRIRRLRIRAARQPPQNCSGGRPRVPPSLSPPHLLLHLPNLYVRFRPFPLCPFPSTAGLVSPVHSLVPGPDVFSPSTLAAARRTKIRPCTTGLCATTEGAILRTNPAHCGAVCSSATDSPPTTALKPSRRPRKPPERPRRSRICNCCSHLLPSDRTKVGFRLSTLGSPATLLSRPARKWRSPVHDRTTASARLPLLWPYRLVTKCSQPQPATRLHHLAALAHDNPACPSPNPSHVPIDPPSVCLRQRTRWIAFPRLGRSEGRRHCSFTTITTSSPHLPRTHTLSPFDQALAFLDYAYQDPLHQDATAHDAVNSINAARLSCLSRSFHA
jgi:hypothetical protein